MNNRFTEFIKNRAYNRKSIVNKAYENSLSHEQIATLVYEKISFEKKVSVKELCKYMKKNHDIPRSFYWRRFLNSLDFVAMRHGTIIFKTPDGAYEELLKEIPRDQIKQKFIRVINLEAKFFSKNKSIYDKSNLKVNSIMDLL